MVNQRAPARRGLAVPQGNSLEKDGQPLTKLNARPMYKRKVDVSSLFDFPKRKAMRFSTDEVLRSQPGKSGKSGKSSSSAKIEKGSSHPIFLGFKDTTNRYRQGATEQHRDYLQPVYEALVQRVHGFGQHEAAPPKPELSALVKLEKVLVTPIGETTLQLTDPNGHESRTKLRESMGQFKRYCDSMRKQVEGYQDELAKIDMDLKKVVDGLVANDHEGIKELEEALAAELKSMEKELRKIHQETLTDIKEAQAEDRRQSAEANKKLTDFLKGW